MKNYLKIILFVLGIIIILIALGGFGVGDYFIAFIIFLIGFLLCLPKVRDMFLHTLEQRKKFENLKNIKKVSEKEVESEIIKYSKRKLRNWFKIILMFFIIMLISALLQLNENQALISTFLTTFIYGYYIINHNKIKLIFLERLKIEIRHYNRKKIEEKHAKEEEKFRKTQKSRGLVEHQSKWGTPEQVKEWKEIEYGIDRNFMNFSHFEFEEFITKLFRKMGYITQLTPKTGDYGVDIIAKDKNDTTAVQAKQFKHGNNVSNVVVQQVLGAMWKVKANKAIIITTSDFTVQAKVQAREAPIELWNLQTLKSMVRKYFIESDK